MSGSAERFFKVRNYYWYNLLFWLILFLLEVIQVFSNSYTFGSEFEPQLLIRWPLSVYLVYWALSLLVIRWYIRTARWPIPRFIAYHGLASLIFGVLHKFLHPIVGILLERLILPKVTLTAAEIWGAMTATYFDVLSGVAMYWLLILILRALTYYQRFQERNHRTLELEAELGQSRLQTMKVQMQPHFLFNAFNTISMMIRGDRKEEAIEMISDLGEMLRQSLSKNINQFMTLDDELEITRKYVNVESKRYAERVKVEWDIDDKVLGNKIPALIIQPLVENAFKHGVSKSTREELIRISCKQKNGKLAIEVFNTGSELPSDWDFQRSTGIGLSNTTERLSKLYKHEVKLLIEELQGGISVKFELPLE